LTVPLRVRLLLSPQRRFPPTSGRPTSYPYPALPGAGAGTGAPVTLPVASGFMSMTRPRCRPVSPTSWPDWPTKDALARRAGAQEDLDVVVAEDLIAVGQARRGAAVALERPDAEIDRGGRVPDQDLRGVRRGHAVVGGVLREAGEERGPGPDGLVEPAVHGDGGVDARRLHLRPAVVARGGRRRRERRDRQEERRRRHRGQRPYFRRILLTSSSGIASTRVPLASVVVAVKSAS